MEQPSATVRQVSRDEALSFAIRLQKNGRLADAEEIYRTILEKVPDDPDAVHYSGVLAQQLGRTDQAVALIERSLELDPDQADWHSNLGIALQAQGKLDEAVAAYQHAIALNPDHANAHSNLGVLLRAQGKEVEAEAAYRTAVRLNPEHTDAYTNLGILLNGQGRTREAVVCYCKVITLRPKHPDARKLLAMAHYTIGEIDKATEIFAGWLEEEPDDPTARHMLAACSGRDVPARASDAYVETTFDNFADSFDAKLATLSYRAPALVAGMLAESGLDPSNTLDVLDAGCGTGLCGPLMAPYARRLVGVDLSGRMLARAKDRNVYDELVKAELTAYLRGHDTTFDVILSADTLVYFGPLEDVISAAASALRPGGRLAFTVEEFVDPDGGAATFCIKPHGRYNHARTYIEQALAKVNLQAAIAQAELRMESGVPVAGLVVRAAKSMGV